MALSFWYSLLGDTKITFSRKLQFQLEALFYISLYFNISLYEEAVAQTCSVKKVFEIKVCNVIKIETLAQVFSCEFCEVSKKTFSYRTPPVAASVCYC